MEINRKLFLQGCIGCHGCLDTHKYFCTAELPSPTAASLSYLSVRINSRAPLTEISSYTLQLSKSTNPNDAPVGSELGCAFLIQLASLQIAMLDYITTFCHFKECNDIISYSS